MARAASIPGDLNIFGTDPFNLVGSGGTSMEGPWIDQNANQTGVPPPRLPQVRTGPSTGGTATRTVASPAPAPVTATGTTAGAAPAGATVPQQVQTLLQRAGPIATPQALAALEPDLNALGITLQRDSQGVVRGRLYLPGGGHMDVVSNGGWGRPWTMSEGGGGGGGTGMGAYFTDPTQQFLMGGMDARLAQIQSMLQNLPSLNQYQGLVNQGVAQYGGTQATPASMTAALQAISQYLGSERPQNAQLPEVTANLRTRIGDLRADPYSASDEAALQAKAFDQLERDRTAAKARVLEQLGGMGHAATSGIVARALQEVDQQYDGFRAQNTNALALDEMNRREMRGSQADQLELSLANLGGIDQQAEMAWKQQQVAAGVTGAQLEVGWEQEKMRRYQAAVQLSGGLAAAQMGLQQWQNTLGDQAFQVSATPYNMGLSSLSAANNVLNGQINPLQVLGALGGLSNQQSYQNQLNTQNTGQYLNGLLQLLGTLYNRQTGSGG